MKKSAKIICIILAVLLGSFIAGFTDGVIRPEYIIKTAVKVLTFASLPAMYFIINRDERKHLKTLFIPTKKALFLSLALGVGVFSVVVSAFFLLRDTIDFSAFTNNLITTAGVNKNNFIFVALYICIVNSFFEELFFRAFAFLCLKRHTKRIVAYAFSALTFALYHTGMTAAFVAPWVFALMLFGLFLGGIIFNFVDEKTESMFPSWLCHLFANLATNTIGFILLSAV